MLQPSKFIAALVTGLLWGCNADLADGNPCHAIIHTECDLEVRCNRPSAATCTSSWGDFESTCNISASAARACASDLDDLGCDFSKNPQSCTAAAPDLFPASSVDNAGGAGANPSTDKPGSGGSSGKPGTGGSSGKLGEAGTGGGAGDTTDEPGAGGKQEFATPTGYYAVTNVDWPGYEISLVSGTSGPACASLCNEMSTCVAFVVDQPKSGDCSLRSNEGDAAVSTATTYLREAQNSIYLYSNVQVAVDHPGSDIAVSYGKSALDCATACRANAACAGFVMGGGADTGTCWLKSYFGVSTSNAARTSYLGVLK